MVQPGQRKEENILKWLKNFPKLKQMYVQQHPSAGGAISKVPSTATSGNTAHVELPPGAGTPPATSSTDSSINPSSPAASDQKTDLNSDVTGQQTPKQDTYSEKVTKGSGGLAYTKPLVVNMHASGKASDPSSSVSSTDSGDVVVNELLCFAQNRINSMAMDHVVNLCAEFYSVDAINAAKNTLFHTVKDLKHRLPDKRGPNKGRDEMRDIAVVLYSTELSNMPTFVARNLSNLPPLGANDFDVTNVMQEVVNIKQDIKLLCNTQSTLAKLLQENIHSSQPQTPTETGTEQHGTSDVTLLDDLPPNDSIDSVEDDFLLLDYTSCSDDSDVDLRSHTDDVSLQNDNDFAHAYQEASGYNSSAQDRKPETPRWRGSERRGNKPRRRTSSPASDRRQQRKSNDVIYATGSTMDIKAAHGSNPRKDSGPHRNRTVTGVFITRLNPRLTSRQIESFIKRETGLKVRPEKLETKFDSYSSFYIPGDGHIRSMLLDGSLWPSGALLKPFYS